MSVASIRRAALPFGLLLPGRRLAARGAGAARRRAGHAALALTDHNSVSGSMELAQGPPTAGSGRSTAPRSTWRSPRPPVVPAMPPVREAIAPPPGRPTRATSPCSCATSAAGATSAGSSRSPTPTPATAPPGRERGEPWVDVQGVLDHAEGLVCLTGCAGRSVLGRSTGGSPGHPTARRGCGRLGDCSRRSGRRTCTWSCSVRTPATIAPATARFAQRSPGGWA